MEKLIIKGWLARDKDNTLTLFQGGKPTKDKKCGVWERAGGGDDYGLFGLFDNPENALPSIKWKDLEPTECELTIKLCK